ncbi:MAG: type 4a pilus biogenesis protein PilO [Planctomycetes bacterium]|nr:type 4a pilus biogenesis protein PilO [Planctomycetota bacterium]
MTASRERWMLFGAFVLTVLFVCFFIVPNYQSANNASVSALALEDRIEQLERRRVEVEKMHQDLKALQTQVQSEYKSVPHAPDTAQIVKALSLEVDGQYVHDQSFTAGAAAAHFQQDDGFQVQPLAVTLHADFDSIFSVIQKVESMQRLIRVSSLHISAGQDQSESEMPILEAAIGLHAMYDNTRGDQ